MPKSPLKIQKCGYVLRIIFDRAAKGNIIDSAMARELKDTCLGVNSDENVRVVLITANGKDFCIGSEFEQFTPDQDINHYQVASAIGNIEKPVIVAIQGKCLGQGLELALACDIRLAAANAQFGFPGIARGFIPADGGTQRLPRIIGKGKALEMILTAIILDAGEAEVLGMVSKVCEVSSLAGEAEQLAIVMAKKAPVALRYVKEAVNKGLDLTQEQGLRLEADLYFLLHTTADRTEGINAFLEKRTPEFNGK